MAVSKKLIEEFRKIPTGTLSDAVDQLDQKGFMTGVVPVLEDVKMVGPAVTVRFDHIYRRDYDLAGGEHLLRAIDESEPGSVIVLGSEVKDLGTWGGLLSTASKAHGMAGAVLDQATRDIAEIRELSFPVFAGTVNPSSYVFRLRTVSLNEPIECGGVLVHPGDVVAGDDDGVVVVPAARAEEVLELALEMEGGEAKMVAALRKGRSIVQSLEEIGRI
ncbi:MAG: RraA family protein [Candidatus Thermoplasmatota archaeon]|nr:RraA family protein [Candidatus Thermoplasmatota archaeon]